MRGRRDVLVLELDAVGALEPEHLPRLVGRGDLVAKLLDDAPDFRHLLGVAGGEFACVRPSPELKLTGIIGVVFLHPGSAQRKIALPKCVAFSVVA